MKLTLLRHAQIPCEYQGSYVGHLDIPLSVEGIEEAKKLQNQLQKQNFDAIYCSDLLRCRQTLAQIQLPQQTYFTTTLREKSWGKHEGMHFEEIEKSGLLYSDFSSWIDALDGESVEFFQTRVWEFFEQLKQTQYTHVLAVTHAGVIRTLLQKLHKLSLEEAFALKVPYASFQTIEI